MPRKGRTPDPTSDGDAPEPFFFEGIESPNGTIFPDALLDFVMPFLSPAEWKVCSYIVRRTFGWKKASDRISLEQICRGIVRRDGTALDYGTRLDRKTAIKALRGLEAKGVIVAQRNYSAERGFEATTYGLRFRGQPPTRTLGEKLPQDSQGLGENLHQPPGGAVPPPPMEAVHQAGGGPPHAPVALLHPQPTRPATKQQQGERGGADPRNEWASAVQGLEASPLGGLLASPAVREGAGDSQPACADGAGVGSVEPGSGDSSDAVLWAAALARLAEQMSAANYQTWLAETRPLGRRERTLVVGAPSSFVCEWLQARFRPLVRRALLALAPELEDVAFAVSAR